MHPTDPRTFIGRKQALPRVRRGLKALRNDRGGVSTIEFALITVPLLMILFAIIEIGLAFSMSIALANATASVGRTIRVGTSVAPGVAVTTSSGSYISLSDFKAAVCAKVFLVTNSACARNIQIDMRTLASFQTSTPASPITGPSFSNNGFCFYSGVSGAIVEMRTYYMWSLINPLLWATLQNITSMTVGGATTTGHWMGVGSTEVFVIEPNGAVANTGAGC